MLKANRQINIPVCQLEFRLWKTTFPAEVKDIGDASAPGFHQATLEEDFTDEFVDGVGLGPSVEGFRGGAWRKSAGVGVNQIVAEEDLRGGRAGSLHGVDLRRSHQNLAAEGDDPVVQAGEKVGARELGLVRSAHGATLSSFNSPAA